MMTQTHDNITTNDDNRQLTTIRSHIYIALDGKNHGEHLGTRSHAVMARRDVEY